MLKDRINEDIKAALREGDALKVSTLRMLSAAFSNLEIAKRGQGEMSEQDYEGIVKKEAKKRTEAIEAYKTAGRAESQAQEEKELELLSVYLPAQMSEEELKKIVDEVVAEKGTENMGLLIGEVVKRAGGQADGGVVSKLVRERIS